MKSVFITFSSIVTVLILGLHGQIVYSASVANQSLTGKPVEDVYIPKNLNDSFIQLEKLFKPDDFEKIKTEPEKNMIRYHRTIGMWMRNNWGLWRGLRLKQYFNNLGVNHPDDMSAIILTSFWRHLHKQPIKLEEQIKVCQDYWAKGIKINRRTTGLQLDYDVSEDLK